MASPCEVRGCPATATNGRRCAVHGDAVTAREVRAVGRLCWDCKRVLTDHDWVDRRPVALTKRERRGLPPYRHVWCGPRAGAPDAVPRSLFEELEP